jgi:SAM-dependent methyltransferase
VNRSRQSGHRTVCPERLDVATRIPRTKEQCEHYARYVWASRLVHGDTLDIACGTGYGARLLARHARVSGVDRDEEALETARARVAGHFTVAEAPPIPFPEASFDFVVCFETVEHVADDLEFIREIRRVLRPGGELLISTPNKDISAPGDVPLNEWHLREYTLVSLKTLLEAAGLEVVTDYGQSFSPKPRRGHTVMWRLNGLTWCLPSIVRSAMRALLGDAEVRAFDPRRPDPGYWLVRARRPISGPGRGAPSSGYREGSGSGPAPGARASQASSN